MVYSSVRSCMLHDSETWLWGGKTELAVSRAEMRMVRQMCGVKLSDKVACVELWETLGLEDIVAVLQRNRLKWYGNVLWKDGSVRVKKYMYFVVECARPWGRPKRIWKEVVEEIWVWIKIRKLHWSHHHHHIRFWYLWCCGCPGLRGRQHLATPHTRSPWIPV